MTLELLAEKTMDLYYQQYKSQEDFFELEDFMFYCSVAYAFLLQEDYNEMYKASKQDTGIAEGEINPEWYVPEVLNVKRNPVTDEWEAQLTNKPFSFRFDKTFSSIGNIEAAGGNCQKFIRSHANRNNFRDRLPNTKNVYWYPQGRKITFKNVKCGLKSVRIYYIPSLADLAPETEISEAFGEPVMKRTLALMFEARNGKVINLTNDQNVNAVMESEINPSYRKGKS
jgi:hypothetical protein